MAKASTIQTETVFHEPDLKAGVEQDHLASLVAVAEKFIGDRERALAWLRTPNVMLGAAIPLDAAATSTGRKRVVQILGQIAYGGVA